VLIFPNGFLSHNSGPTPIELAFINDNFEITDDSVSRFILATKNNTRGGSTLKAVKTAIGYHLLPALGLRGLDDKTAWPLTCNVFATWKQDLKNDPIPVTSAEPVAVDTRRAILDFVPQGHYQQMIHCGSVINNQIANRSGKQMHELKTDKISYEESKKVHGNSRAPALPRHMLIDFTSTKTGPQNNVIACICPDNLLKFNASPCTISSCPAGIVSRWLKVLQTFRCTNFWPDIHAPAANSSVQIKNLQMPDNDTSNDKRSGIHKVASFNVLMNEMLPEEFQTDNVKGRSTRKGFVNAGRQAGLAADELQHTTKHKDLNVLNSTYNKAFSHEQQIKNSTVLAEQDLQLKSTTADQSKVTSKRHFDIPSSSENTQETTESEIVRQYQKAKKVKKENVNPLPNANHNSGSGGNGGGIVIHQYYGGDYKR